MSKILVVDDHPQNVKLLTDLLGAKGYDVVTAVCGREALDRVADTHPDLVLLDVMMPGMNGYEVCSALRANPATAMLPVVMVTALDAREERVQGIEAGADDFLSKPINQPELLARVRSLLRIKSLHDTVQSQSAQLAEWNALLEHRVHEQLGQLERLGKLKRFFSPQLAEAIVSGGADDPLRSHRREVVVIFLDLRGFTAFAETAEPEEVMRVLREYHAAMGKLILAHEGTLERFTGDGMMVFFNDPVIVSDPAERALRMAIAMCESVNDMSIVWRRHGYDLGLGIGIAQGFATIGAIGFEGRFDYGAVGTVTNLAARLCSEAAGGQILINHKALAAVEPIVDFEEIGEVHLKGFSRPIPAARIVALKAPDTSRA